MKMNATLLTVDSEHSAIFQCLAGEEQNPLEHIYLTASGGPFRGTKRVELAHVTWEQALMHANLSMGADGMRVVYGKSVEVRVELGGWCVCNITILIGMVSYR